MSPVDRRALFVRDLTRSLDQQLIGVDLEDVNAVFDGLRVPALGIGYAAGVDRYLVAAEAALVDAGSVRRSTLVVIATAPREWRHGELKLTYNVVRDRSAPDAHVIYAPCEDPRLPSGRMRVAVLTG